jgi:hypothetical protein
VGFFVLLAIAMVDAPEAPNALEVGRPDSEQNRSDMTF